MRLGFNAIPSTNRPVQLSAGCVAFGGVESSHRGPGQPLRPGRRRSTGFINTRLHISDNGVKMRFYLDRFLQHRHSASRLRLSVLVVSFHSFLSPLSSLQSPAEASVEDLNLIHRPLPAEHSRRIPKRVKAGNRGYNCAPYL